MFLSRRARSERPPLPQHSFFPFFPYCVFLTPVPCLPNSQLLNSTSSFVLIAPERWTGTLSTNGQCSPFHHPLNWTFLSLAQIFGAQVDGLHDQAQATMRQRKSNWEKYVMWFGEGRNSPTAAVWEKRMRGPCPSPLLPLLTTPAALCPLPKRPTESDSVPKHRTKRDRVLSLRTVFQTLGLRWWAQNQTSNAHLTQTTQPSEVSNIKTEEKKYNGRIVLTKVQDETDRERIGSFFFFLFFSYLCTPV